jgi:two-component system sensor histidine kinase CpxA
MSLFWKIFGWFWLSQVLVTSALVTYFSTRTRPLAPPPGPPPLWSLFEWQRVLILLSVGALVSYGLARYLASPATKLRRATHQLAEGDLTARVGPQMGRRRDELADMGRDFDVMAERIESLIASERRLAESERRTVEAQQRLLADISHELRSPLARIAYALDLAQGSADAETRGYLGRIERESARLNELIGQLLTLARLEAAPEHSTLEAATPVDLSSLLVEVCQDADFEARGRGRKVLLMKNEPCRVRGSAGLLRSAVENVVRNAVRHTPEGTTVEVALHCDEWQTVVAVRDFGAGVPEASLPELFRPFYRVESARERESGGVGLGLSITERAVRFHGGSARAENAPGGGLLVRLTLPLSGATPPDG